MWIRFARWQMFGGAVLLLCALLFLIPLTRPRAIDLSTLSAEELLDRAVKLGLTKAATVPELLQSLSFNHVWNKLTSDEVLALVVKYSLTPGHTTVDDLKGALPAHDILLTRSGSAINPTPLDELAPSGVLQVLGAPIKGGPLLRDREGGDKPWTIVPDAYADLQEAFTNDKTEFLSVLSPRRLFEVIDDSIASPNGSSKTFMAYAWLRQKVPAGLSHVVVMANVAGPTYGSQTEDEYLASLKAKAEDVKKITDTMPEGHRVIKLHGIERLDQSIFFDGIYAPLRDSSGAMVQATSYCTKASNPKQYPTGYLHSLWFDDPNPQYNWSAIVQKRIDTFFKEYEKIGGKVDAVNSDIENDWLGLYLSRCIWFNDKQDFILSDPRWPALWDQLHAAGIPDLINIGTVGNDWYVRKNWKAVLWDALMERRQADAFNAALFTPIQSYFPNVQFFDYEWANRSAVLRTRNYNSYPSNIGSIGTIFGSHQILNTYGYTFRIDTPTATIDSPVDPAHPTLWETLLADVMEVRSMLVSHVPSMAYLDHPWWPTITASNEDIRNMYYEKVFHAGMNGVDTFAEWTAGSLYNDKGVDVYNDGYQIIDSALDELKQYIGYTDRRPLSLSQVRYSDTYLLSGMEVHGQRLWRFTPGIGHAGSTRSTNGFTELVVDDNVVATIPSSTAIPSHAGYWIVQTATNGPLIGSVDETLAALASDENNPSVIFTSIDGGQIHRGENFPIGARARTYMSDPLTCGVWKLNGNPLDPATWGGGQAPSGSLPPCP